MSKSFSEEQWYKLDNAAKIFPPNTGLRDTKIIRFACKLTEKVDGEILKKAVDSALDIFPHYRSVLRKGLFWYYFQQSDIPPIVEEENILPFTTLYDGNKQNLLFRVTYFNKRINLEVYHAITDGAGGIEFFKRILYYYFKEKYSDEIPDDFVLTDSSSSVSQKLDDSYKHYYTSDKNKITIPESKKAYTVKGLKLSEYRTRITEITMPVDKLLSISKEYKTTLTVYLASLFTLAVHKVRPRSQNKPIVLCIPVNLRKYFPSDSARNFFGVFEVKYKFDKNIVIDDNELLKDIVQSYNSQFKEKLTKEKLENSIDKMLALENNTFIKIIPLIIKNPVMHYFGANNDKQMTASFSNIGIINIDSPMDKYIENFIVSVATKKLQVALTTYNNKLTITVTSPFVSSDTEMCFVRELSALGIDVTVTSNTIN